MKESPLFWPAALKGGTLFVLDETQIPQKEHYIEVKNTSQAVAAIKSMKTRAFGQLLVVLNTFLLECGRKKCLSQKDLLEHLRQTALELNNSRPTFPFADVTSMAVGCAMKAFKSGEEIGKAMKAFVTGYLKGIRYRRMERVEKIAGVIKNGDAVLTHCNVSGELAMAADICRRQKKDVHFFCTETRPYLQGAKLTAWELKRMGAKVTLIADNAVGNVMADGLVSKVIVGSDRSCANGDFANKIGTYQIAVLAKEFDIPFYVLLQPSRTIKKGADIPVEVRDADELLNYQGRRFIPGDVDAFYPGFDVVPHKYVTEAITIDVS